jgi:hypothetical protein
MASTPVPEGELEVAHRLSTSHHRGPPDGFGHGGGAGFLGLGLLASILQPARPLARKGIRPGSFLGRLPGSCATASGRRPWLPLSVVESKFDGANGTVALGLSATEGLKEAFVRVSQSQLDRMARQTIVVRQELDCSHGTIEDRIGEQRQLHCKAEGRVREASETLSKTISERRSAEGAQVLMTEVGRSSSAPFRVKQSLAKCAWKGSIMRFGLANAVLFPPSLLVTGATMAASAGAEALASIAWYVLFIKPLGSEAD